MEVNGLHIAIEKKAIKNMHLAVYPPDARVHVSAPEYLDDNDIRSFIISKWDWIESQRTKILNQPRQTEREYVSGETYYHLGSQYRLRVLEKPGCAHTLEKQGGFLIMTVQPGTSTENRALVLREWQRAELKTLLQEVVPTWLDRLEESDVNWEVKQMRSQWGSCVAKKRHVLFNLELARVPRSCIEYVVLHELTHLKVQNHNKMFEALLTKYMPQWRARRKELNEFIALPIEEGAAGGKQGE